jgi:hypothetical protein
LAHLGKVVLTEVFKPATPFMLDIMTATIVLNNSLGCVLNLSSGIQLNEPGSLGPKNAIAQDPVLLDAILNTHSKFS